MSSAALNKIDFTALKALQDYCYTAARSRGFHDATDNLQEALAVAKSMPGGPARNVLLTALSVASIDRFGNRLTLIMGEAIEAHEEVRSGRGPAEQWENTAPGKEGKPEGVPSELADIIIRVFDLAGEHGIDLSDVIRRKLEFNDGRAHMHGKAF